MQSFITFIVVPVLILGVMMVVVVRRGLQMKLLVQDGVDTMGMVKAKLKHSGHKNASRSHRIRYAYLDGNGKAQEHVSMVTADFWRAHEEGGPIDLVYSASRPGISSPKHLVDQCREALERRR